jgi:iron complex transport system substrate-binding protein
MSTADRINGAAAAGALALALVLGGFGPGATAEDSANTVMAASSVKDADGYVVQVRPFHRIASGSVVADALLLELADSDSVYAMSAYGAAHLPYAYRYAGKALVQNERDTEGIIALKPDLFLFHSFGSPADVALVRSAGVAAFDLGEMHGVASFLANARTVATLLGHPERGEAFVAAFQRRFDHVAAGLDAGRRRRGIYLSVYGNHLYGGAQGTSYHDVLEHAGLIDAAVGYVNWPQYSPEQVLALDPDIIVTKAGMKSLVCRVAGLDRLKACRTDGIIEVAPDVIDDPGLLMLDAAEEINAQVYGASPEQRLGAAR